MTILVLRCMMSVQVTVAAYLLAGACSVMTEFFILSSSVLPEAVTSWSRVLPSSYKSTIIFDISKCYFRVGERLVLRINAESYLVSQPVPADCYQL